MYKVSNLFRKYPKKLGGDNLGTTIFYILLLAGILMLPRYFRYRGSGYRAASGNGFFKTISDKGNFGEFLTFAYLEKLKGHHRIMTNLYLPKKDGGTTEVDLVMISETGIYVFESKNYSGWIFGDEKSKKWMQTLQNGQKNRFFNPVWQNKGHISALKHVTEGYREDMYKSYIVFSERCTLKKINVTSIGVKVVKRDGLIKTIKQDIERSSKVMTAAQVDSLYHKLKKYARADESVKVAHVESIRSNRS